MTTNVMGFLSSSIGLIKATPTLVQLMTTVRKLCRGLIYTEEAQVFVDQTSGTCGQKATNNDLFEYVGLNLNIIPMHSYYVDVLLT